MLQKQLKLGKKFRTASFNSKLIAFLNSAYFNFFTFAKRWNLVLLWKYNLFHQQPQVRFLPFKSLEVNKKLFFSTLIQNIIKLVSFFN